MVVVREPPNTNFENPPPGCTSGKGRWSGKKRGQRVVFWLHSSQPQKGIFKQRHSLCCVKSLRKGTLVDCAKGERNHYEHGVPSPFSSESAFDVKEWDDNVLKVIKCAGDLEPSTGLCAMMCGFCGWWAPWGFTFRHFGRGSLHSIVSLSLCGEWCQSVSPVKLHFTLPDLACLVNFCILVFLHLGMGQN